jgi:hypothetical protein
MVALEWLDSVGKFEVEVPVCEMSLENQNIQLIHTHTHTHTHTHKRKLSLQKHNLLPLLQSEKMNFEKSEPEGLDVGDDDDSTFLDTFGVR